MAASNKKILYVFKIFEKMLFCINLMKNGNKYSIITYPNYIFFS